MWGLHRFIENGQKRLAVKLPVAVTKNMREFYEARGLQVSPFGTWAYWTGISEYVETMNAGKSVLRFDVPCSHLSETGLCELHGTDKKPRVCREYPTVNTDLSGVADVCTFKIEEVEV